MESPLEEPHKDFLNDSIQELVMDPLFGPWCVNLNVSMITYRLVFISTGMRTHTHRKAHNSFTYEQVSRLSHRCDAHLQFHTQTYSMLQKPRCVQTLILHGRTLHTQINTHTHTFTVMDTPVFSSTHGHLRMHTPSHIHSHSLTPVWCTHEGPDVSTHAHAKTRAPAPAPGLLTH